MRATTWPRARLLRSGALLLALGIFSALAFTLWAGGQLLAPSLATAGSAPPGLKAEAVILPNGDGWVSGWWIRGEEDKASVLLLHGIRANRSSMLGRARLLASHGYSVLLIDLPAHGQSSGRAITLGLRESAAVQAARKWMLRERPDKPIAAIGVSLGGASILLGPSPAGFSAVVLEAVYPDARQALDNRMRMRFGRLGPMLGTLLQVQMKPRLGIGLDQLRPIDHIAGIGAPVLIVAGGQDRHTTPAESRALFDRAITPKEYWLLPDAAHQDFQQADPLQYESRVIGFLERSLAWHSQSPRP